MEIVTSTSNPRIKAIRALHSSKGRRAAGSSLAEGPHVVSALLRSSLRPTLLVLTDPSDETMLDDTILDPPRRCDVLIVTPRVLRSLSDTEEPRGPLAVFGIPALTTIRDRDTVVLHDVSDPGNVGTIVRSAVAFGYDVAVSGSTADPWSPKAIRSSAGAVFEAHIARSEDPVAGSRAAKLRTVATVVAGGGVPPRTAQPTAILIGSEATGLPAALVEGCDVTMTIPTAPGTESLNAAVAASIAMYSLGRGA
jgi:TrmH family RNA methyltransferase